MSVRRGFVDTVAGQIHYRTAGRGSPVVLLHQTPRSSDEYRDVIPILASKMKVLAMDTIGCGDSYKPIKRSTIEDYSRAVVELLNNLHIRKAHFVGHHTGAFIAMEIAASNSDMVDRLVLSNCPYVDKTKRDSYIGKPPIDEVEFKSDGSHLLELWRRREAFYPKNRPDLQLRYFIDALKAGDKIEEGHEACHSYEMEKKVDQIKCPTLLVCGTEDYFVISDQEILREKIKGSTSRLIPGGMVPLPDQMPEEFCQAILPFLL